MYNRFDLYGPVHKGLRSALSSLCFQTGSMDVLSDEQGLKSFLEEFKRVVIILEAHAHDEDLHLNDPYLQYAPQTAKRLEEEHQVLDLKLDNIVTLANQLEQEVSSEERRRLWYQLGRDLTRFTAEYFMHLQNEEGPGMDALWANLTDEQLIDYSIKIRSSIPPHTMMIFLHYMLPAITHTARFEMLSGMKRFAPREAYEAVLRLAENRLDSNSMMELMSALELAPNNERR